MDPKSFRLGLKNRIMPTFYPFETTSNFETMNLCLYSFKVFTNRRNDKNGLKEMAELQKAFKYMFDALFPTRSKNEEIEHAADMCLAYKVAQEMDSVRVGRALRVPEKDIPIQQRKKLKYLRAFFIERWSFLIQLFPVEKIQNLYPEAWEMLKKKSVCLCDQ